MHAVDAEVVQKGIEIVGGSAGLRTGRWIDDRPPEVPPIESNEAVTCGREPRDLVFPYTHAAGSGWRNTTGTPLPPVSTYHNLAPRIVARPSRAEMFAGADPGDGG